MNFDSILTKKIPNHIAIILDGNGRWAKKRLLPRTMGHKKGLENLLEITKSCKMSKNPPIRRQGRAQARIVYHLQKKTSNTIRMNTFISPFSCFSIPCII